MKITITEFIRPHGKTREVELDTVDSTLYASWQKMVEVGARLTLEHLPLRGEICFCVEDPVHGDFDTVISKGSKDEGLTTMILRFNPQEFISWKRLGESLF